MVERPAFAPAREPQARTSISEAAPKWLLLAALFLAPTQAHAQGCAQCLDSTRATPPQVQAAYRHAIYLLGGSALTVFVTGGLLLRNRR